jgi:DHA1 family bicyclomycin/chloramphenicol resistance-like MFS transporter
MGLGTLFAGPLSDTFGRKQVINLGAALYILGAALAWAAPTMELMIAARFIQGIGAAGPRIVSLAVVRDMHSGREMARIVSFIMVVFTIVPALAPLLGELVISLGGWRAIFISFVLFCAIATLWMNLRLTESLPTENRRPFKGVALWDASKQMMALPMVRGSIYVQTMIFSVLFISISLIQPTFEKIFDRADSFATYFFVIGLFCATSSLVNATFVLRYGMRAIITLSTVVAVGATAVVMALTLMGLDGQAQFWTYLIWQTIIFYLMGLTIGNLNALAMEPLGHIAGLAASVMGAIATVCSALIATAIAQTFNETTLTQIIGTLVLLTLTLPALRQMRRLDRPGITPDQSY